MATWAGQCWPSGPANVGHLGRTLLATWASQCWPPGPETVGHLCQPLFDTWARLQPGHCERPGYILDTIKGKAGSFNFIRFSHDNNIWKPSLYKNFHLVLIDRVHESLSAFTASLLVTVKNDSYIPEPQRFFPGAEDKTINNEP